MDLTIEARDFIFSVGDQEKVLEYLKSSEVDQTHVWLTLQDSCAFEHYASLWLNRGATLVEHDFGQCSGTVIGELFLYYRRHLAKAIDLYRGDSLDKFMRLCAYWSWFRWENVLQST